MGITAGTAAAISAVTAVASAGIGAYGAMQQSAAAEKAAKYQQQVADNNAAIAAQNSAYERKVGEAQATDVAMQQAQQNAQVRAAIAANGVDINSGSAEDTQQTQRQTGELNILRSRQNAALAAYGYQTQGANFQAQGQLEGMQARDAASAGAISAGGSLLGGASSLAGNWAKLQQQGAFGVSSPESTENPWGGSGTTGGW